MRLWGWSSLFHTGHWPASVCLAGGSQSAVPRDWRAACEALAACQWPLRRWLGLGTRRPDPTLTCVCPACPPRSARSASVQVKQFYTAPTAIRSLMRSGDEWLKSTTRASLQVRLVGALRWPLLHGGQ